MSGATTHGHGKHSITFLLFFLPALVGAAQAGEAPWEVCFRQAGERYRIAPALLRAIAAVESDLDPAAIRRNRASRDLGLMQINSFWLPELARFGIDERDLLEDPCLNIHVGAWILAQEIRRFGYGWQAVGAYHAGPGDGRAARDRRARYALRVAQKLLALPGQRAPLPDGAPGRLHERACPIDGDAVPDSRQDACPAGRDPGSGRDLARMSGMPPAHAETFGTGG